MIPQICQTAAFDFEARVLCASDSSKQDIARLGNGLIGEGTHCDYGKVVIAIYAHAVKFYHTVLFKKAV